MQIDPPVLARLPSHFALKTRINTGGKKFMNIVILAAGQGKRMHSQRPKVLHRLAGKTLLAHVIDTARHLAPKSLTVVVGHGAEVVRQAFATDSSLQFALQAQQLGTGHAVQQAVPQLREGGQTLILCGDVPLIQPASLRALLAAAGADAVGLMTLELTDPTGYGRILRDGSGQVQAIIEHKDASEAQRAIREINTGILCVPTARLGPWLARLQNNNAQGEYYLTDLIAMAVADGVAVNTVAAAHAWEVQGINDPLQLATLERVWQLEQAHVLLKSGVSLADPARLDVRGALTCGSDVSIDVNCVFEGQVSLGHNVAIGPHCVIKDAVIGDGVRVEAFSHIDGAQVGAGSRIGPYARLRPGSALEQDVHIGNFVELKNTHMGTGAKANHLAYLGDAQVGAGVNFGAGSITANYDGVNKHATVIGAGTHVGSNCVLVAPVNVGEGATIGGGSTISKDAPAGQLTVARARQISLPNWKRPIKQTKP
jgi:bifunctional UDP-N-acetylglucosamine pyrophosphorylase/glucosamine-1-phosphate N-acetyltransferase